jgi:UDP-glucose 4-epimerase
MRTFVTGGAGFIGSHTVEALLAAGHEVLVWDDLSTGTLANLAAVRDQVQFQQADVRDLLGLQAAARAWRPDAFLHLAALASVPRSVADPTLSHGVNLTGTVNVLETARREGISRVVLACSAAIYGNEPGVPKTEAMPAGPTSPYGLEKWQGEQYAALFSTLYGLTTVSLRYFNVFGPRQDPRSPYSGVISIFLDRLLTSQPVVIEGTGEQTRDFVYVADVADANVRALTLPLDGHHRCNLGRCEETSILELYHLLCEAVGRRAEPTFGPPRAGDIFRSFTDVTCAREVLGFVPRYTLAEGLARLVEWYQSSAEQAALSS